MQPANRDVHQVHTFAGGSGKSYRNQNVKILKKEQPKPEVTAPTPNPTISTPQPFQEKWNSIYETAYNKLRELNIIDERGVLTERYSHLTLPTALEQSSVITSFIAKTLVTIKYRPTQDGRVYEAKIPLFNILNEFIHLGSINSELQVANIEIIGGKVANLMGWNFFESSITKLLEHHQTLTQNTVSFSEVVPNELMDALKKELESFCGDVDLRIYMPFMKSTGRELIRTKIIEVVTNNTPNLKSSHIALEYAFENIGRTGSEQNPGLLVSVSDRNDKSELQYDILFHSGMPRASLARRDAFRLVVYDIRYRGWLHQPYHTSEIDNGWGFVLSRLTRKLDIPSIEHCNDKVLGPVQSLSIKGYDIVTENALKTLIQKTFATLANNQNYKDKGLYFYEDIWLENLTHHLNSNPYDGFLLLVELYEHLKSTLSPSEMQLFLEKAWSHLNKLAPKIEQDKLDCALLNTIFKLITKENSNFFEVYNQLKLFLFLDITNPKTLPGEINWKPASYSSIDYYFHGDSTTRVHKLNVRLNLELMPKLDESLTKLLTPMAFDRVMNAKQRTELNPIEVRGTAIMNSIEGLLKTGQKENIRLASRMIVALDMTKPPLTLHLLIMQYYPIIMSNMDTIEEKQNFHDYFDDSLERSVYKPLRTTLGSMRALLSDAAIGADELSAEWIKNLIASRSLHVTDPILKLFGMLSSEKLKVVLETSIPLLLSYTPSCAVKLWNKHKQILSNNIYQKCIKDIYFLKQSENCKAWEGDLEKDFPQNDGQLFLEFKAHSEGFDLNDVAEFLDKNLTECAFQALCDMIAKNDPTVYSQEVWPIIKRLPTESLEKIIKTSDPLKMHVVSLIAVNNAFEVDQKYFNILANVLNEVLVGPQTPELLKLYGEVLFQGRFCQNYAHLSITQKMLRTFAGLVIENMECVAQYSLEFKQGIRKNLTKALQILSDCNEPAAVLNLFFSACSASIGAQYKETDITCLMEALKKMSGNPELNYYEPHLFQHRNIFEAYESFIPMLTRIILQLLYSDTMSHEVEWLNFIRSHDKLLDPTGKLSQQNELYSIARLPEKDLSTKINILKYLHSKNFPFQIKLLKRLLGSANSLIEGQKYSDAIQLLQSLQEGIEAYPEISDEFKKVVSKLLKALTQDDSKLDLLLKTFEVLPIVDGNQWKILLETKILFEKAEFLERLTPLVLKFEKIKAYGIDYDFRAAVWKQFISKIIENKSVKVLDVLSPIMDFNNEIELSKAVNLGLLELSVQVLQTNPKLVKDNINCVFRWYEYLLEFNFLNYQSYSAKELDRDLELIKLLNILNNDAARFKAIKIMSKICFALPAIAFDPAKFKSFKTVLGNLPDTLDDTNAKVLETFLKDFYKKETSEDIAIFIATCVKTVLNENVQIARANIIRNFCDKTDANRTPAQIKNLTEAMTSCIGYNVQVTSIVANGLVKLAFYKKIGLELGKRLYREFSEAFNSHTKERKRSSDTRSLHIRFLVSNLYSPFNTEDFNLAHTIMIHLMSLLLREHENFDAFIIELDNIVHTFCFFADMDLKATVDENLKNGKLSMLQKVSNPQYTFQETTSEDLHTLVLPKFIQENKKALKHVNDFVTHLICSIFKMKKSEDRHLENKICDFALANIEYLVETYCDEDSLAIRTSIYNTIITIVSEADDNFTKKMEVILTKALAKGIYNNNLDSLFELSVFLEIPKFYELNVDNSIKAEKVKFILAHFTNVLFDQTPEEFKSVMINKILKVYKAHCDLSLKVQDSHRDDVLKFLINIAHSYVGVKIDDKYVFELVYDLILARITLGENNSTNYFYYLEQLSLALKSCKDLNVCEVLLNNILEYANALNALNLFSTVNFENMYLSAVSRIMIQVVRLSERRADFIDRYSNLFCNQTVKYSSEDQYKFRAETSEVFIRALADSRFKNSVKRVFEHFVNNKVYSVFTESERRTRQFLKDKKLAD